MTVIINHAFLKPSIFVIYQILPSFSMFMKYHFFGCGSAATSLFALLLLHFRSCHHPNSTAATSLYACIIVSSMVGCTANITTIKMILVCFRNIYLMQACTLDVILGIIISYYFITQVIWIT